MKRILLLLLLAGSLTARASVSIDIQAGDLKTAGGAAPAPTGSLVLLIAAGANGTFSNSLTAGQYVAGDDVVLGAFSLNNNLGGSNATSNSLTNLNVTGLNGEALEIRWFPSTGSPSSFTQYTSSTPTVAGESYGDYAGPTTGTPNGGNPWVVPNDGTSDWALNFITQSLNTTLGSPLSDAEPNADGYANLQVAAVPEPSTYGLLLLGLGVAFGASRAGFKFRRSPASFQS